MSLISEEKRKELEGKSYRELARLIRERKPNLSERVVYKLAGYAKCALKKERFYVLSNNKKSLDEMANELGVSYDTAARYRYALLTLSLVKKIKRRSRKVKFDKEYAKKLDELGKRMYKYLSLTPVEEIKEELEGKTSEEGKIFSEQTLKTYARFAKTARNRLHLYLKGIPAEEVAKMVGISTETAKYEIRALYFLFPECEGRLSKNLYKGVHYRMNGILEIKPKNVEYEERVIGKRFQIPRKGAKMIGIYDPKDGEWETWYVEGKGKLIGIPRGIIKHLKLKPGDKIKVAYFYDSLS